MAVPANDVSQQTGLPARIGRFVPLRRLGRGAQGAVYLATDPDLGREVAIKTLLVRGREPDRLLEEARNVGRLQHANIVPLYAIDTHDGLPHLVYQYVEGRTLRELLATDKALPIHRALEISSALCDAMSCAHELGIVHRDLSPANILIDATGAPRVLDFGVASVVGTGTGHSDIVGTPNYMAPEALNGQPAGPAADVFSLAAVLHEMLTGVQAFAADNPMAVMYQIAHERSLPPSMINRAVEPALDAIVGKGLSKDVADRYQSAAEMRAAIDAYLQPASETEDDAGGAGAQHGSVEFLLRRMRRKPDFPAVSQHVAEISNKTRTADACHANELANVILKDFALTTKVLRLCNSAIYGQYGGEISTVSRAVLILGYEQVRLAALSIALFEHLKNGDQAEELKHAMCGSLLSAMIARGVARRAGIEVEEAFIAAMFHRLGRLLTVYYFPEETADIKGLMASKDMTESAAVRAVLGIGYVDIGMAVGREWQLPDDIVNAMKELRGEPLARATSHGTAIAQVAVFANEICAAAADPADDQPRAALDGVVARFRDCFDLDLDKVAGIVRDATEEMQEYAAIIEVDVRASATVGRLARRCIRAQVVATEAVADPDARADPGGDAGTAAQTDGAAASAAGADLARRAILVNAIADMTNALLNGCALNDLFVMLLEGLYRGMGFSHVLFCARDPRQGVFAARYGFGAGVEELIPRFRFTPAGDTDVFSHAVSSGCEHVIIDAGATGLRHAVPAWCRELVAPRSLVLFPLVANKRCIAVIYADTQASPAIITAEDLRLMKTLVNQAVLAVRQHVQR
ncbi:MAG: HDOD domain-containing protein [Gammaproteobacteria bacterium]|nr:HDOD domain-containing protein [Gammaproteobacteria bacterium]